MLSRALARLVKIRVLIGSLLGDCTKVWVFLLLLLGSLENAQSRTASETSTFQKETMRLQKRSCSTELKNARQSGNEPLAAFSKTLLEKHSRTPRKVPNVRANTVARNFTATQLVYNREIETARRRHLAVALRRRVSRLPTRLSG